MQVDNLIIEITRRCNKACYFCLRGEAQNIDISDEILETFLKRFSYINTLTITGGEPSLAPQKIMRIIEIIKQNRISLNSFYIATNGEEASSEFVNSLLQLYLECEDPEMSSVDISNTDNYDEYSDAVRTLQVFRFTNLKYNDYSEANWIDEGLAQENGVGKRAVSVYPIVVKESEYDDISIEEGDIYLNALGDIIGCCNLSYESQDDYTICHYDDDDLLGAIKKYNAKLECE